MATKKASTESPKIFVGVSATQNPNTDKIAPSKIGDIFISGTSFFFAFGLAGTQWGTAGTV